MTESFSHFTDPQRVRMIRTQRHWRERASLVGEILFNAIDEDGNGTVSLREIEHAVMKAIDKDAQHHMCSAERRRMLHIEQYLDALGLDIDNCLASVRSHVVFYGHDIEIDVNEFM